MARKTRQQAEREAKKRRERAAPPPKRPAFPSREPVGPAKPELADVREPRERGDRRPRTRVPPPPAMNWWLDPGEQQAIAEQAALIAERELTPPTGQGRLRTRVPPRTDFDPTARGFMGVRTPTGEALSWEQLQELRAAGVTGFQTEKGGIDLSRLSRVPTPPTREELREPGFMPLKDRPAPYSGEYMAEGVREFRERMAGHFQVGEAPPEDILRTTTVMAEPTPDPWTGLMQDPVAQERVALEISPRAGWRFAKARLGLRHILGGGEALADVAVTTLQQTAYWVERGLGEFYLRNMVDPDQYRRQQENTARYRELFPKMPGKAEERERMADEYQSLYEAIYDPGVAEGIRHRGITELARMAYSPLPNQERAWKRVLDGENPDHVIAEEMDPVSELIGQLSLDPTNYLIGPAIGWAKRGVVASRSAKYWKVATVADPDVLRFMELGTKFSRKGARFGVIPEYLDAFALTRGARAQKMGDTVQTVLHHLSSRFSHDPDALIAALRGVGDETANIATKIGVEPESEAFKIFDAIAKEVVDLDNLDEMESLKDVISPAQYSLLPEAPPKDVNVFNPARFMEELEPVIYSKSRKLLHTELDQYKWWNIPGRTAQAVKGIVSYAYLGANPGYLMRNVMNNFSTVLVDDMTTLRSVVRYGDDFAERWKLEGIPGYERGLGTMAEIDKSKAKLLHKPAAWSEDVASKLVVRHQAENLYGGLWKAAGADYFPATLREYMPGASDEFVDFMQNVGRDSLTAGEFRKNVDDIYRLMGGEPPIAGGAPDVPPRYPFSVDRLDPQATIPHNVKAEMQGIVDELVETGDEVAFQADMTDLRHDVAMRTRLTELKDSMFWDTENDCLVLGSQIEGIDDLPEPIHFFYRGPKRLERKLGMPKAESQELYAEIIRKTTGAEPVLPTSKLDWGVLSDDQQVHYVRELLGRLGKKEELRDFEKAYLAVEPEKWMHLVRSPADVAAGPLPQDDLLDLMAGFREAVIDKDVRMVDNGRIAKMMGFEGEDAEKAAQQLADELYKYGGLGAAESRSGLRPVMFKPSDGIQFTREDALNAHIKVQEEFLERQWGPGRRGGAPTKSDRIMREYNQQKLAWLTGEADDIPMLKNLVSPLEAEPMGMGEAGDFISAMDEVVSPEATGAIATLPTNELEAMKEQHIGAMTDWLGKIEFIDEEAGMLPTYRDAQRYWNKHTGEVILAPKGGAHEARMKWDVVLPEWQSRYPIDDWYRGSVGEAVYMKVDEDLFRDIVERRMAIRTEQKSLARLVEGAEERVDEIDGVLQQRAIEEAKRAAPLEGRDIYLRGIRDDLASGQKSVDDIDSILKEGAITPEEAQEFKVFHEQHWKLQDEQNRILEEEILRRQTASLEQRPLGPEGMPEEIGTSREFAYMEARQAGPSTFGGSRMSDAHRAQEVYIDDIIHRAMTDVPDGVKKPPAPPSDFTDESYEALMRWADEQADPAREGAKIVAETNAVAIRDFALLDYSQRRNFDLWIAMGTPYHYWYTRSGFNWSQRMATKPAAFNANVTAQRALKQVNKDLPSRLRTSIGIPAPMLKEWMGDKLYIDPFRNLAAFNNLYPWAGMTQFDYDDPVEAQNGFKEWGDLFDRVQMRFFFYIDLPRRWASGEWSETYYQLPQTAGLGGTTALMKEAGILSDIIPPGGFNLEANPREWVGMPRAYFTKETYWPMQHLAMMVALGETSEDEARKAWYDKLILGQDNEMWDAAYQRGGAQRGVSEFGSFWLGQPFNIYPKGEDLMRGWSAELDELGYMPEERPEGTAAERFEYWETHPALRLRSDAFAMMGEKAWMYKDEDGKVDVEAYTRARDEWLAKGGGPGALEQRYKLGEYGKAKDNIDIQWMGIQNDLIDEGMVPGTKAYEIADEWFREYVRDPLYGRYKEYFDGADEPPYRASPEEQEAWWTERRARELASVYYDVEPEGFQDPEGNTDWDAFYAARKEALNTLPPDERLEVERYIHRNRIPEEEAMWAIEERVYQPIRDLIGEISDMEDAETKKQLQAELDALKERLDEATVDALVDELERVLELHPDWGEEQTGRYAAFDIPSYDTWARKGYEPRQAFDQAFRTFYWSLSSGVRSTLRDEDRARKAGLPDNYLGPEFEEYEEGHHKLEEFDELPDDQVLDWLAKVGQIVQLEAEGFPIPGRDMGAALSQIPGYEQLARGEDLEWEVKSRVGAALYPEPKPRPYKELVEEAPDFDTETERLTALMQEASAEVAVQGEETAEIDLVEPTFELPGEATEARIEKAYADMDAWVAGGEEGDWTEEMEWWFGDPDSPKSQFWSTYGTWRAPKEKNPLGWGLLPRELKDNPFVSMIFDAMDDEDADVSEDVYIEAKLAIDEFVEEHGEELMQAREEFIGYLATLNPEIEKLQDQYYEFASGSKERRDFAQQHPELVAYWEQKREYKNSHPLMVEYYFPGTTVGTTYQRRGWGGGGGGGRRGAEADGWQQFTEAAGPEIIGALIDYWGGTRPLSDVDRQYLVGLFKRYKFGAGNFEAWLSLLQQMWQKSLGGGEYEIPMRKHGIVVGERQKQQGTSRWPTAPTRVRYLGRRS